MAEPTGRASMPAIAPDGVAVRAAGLHREFRSGDRTLHVLRGVDLAVPAGAFVAITGRSGAGKTTLLNLLGGIDRPAPGHVEVLGLDVGALDEDGLVELRRDRLGIVFQAACLIPMLSAAENVELPLRLRRVDPEDRDARVRDALAAVGLAARLDHRPDELSGGEQQRVAIARALVARAPVVLADEPTSQLDVETSRAIVGVLRAAVVEQGLTVIATSHDAVLLDAADELYALEEGRLVAGTMAARVHVPR
jgi:putative ABC transport system ATP-binding protein